MTEIPVCPDLECQNCENHDPLWGVCQDKVGGTADLFLDRLRGILSGTPTPIAVIVSTLYGVELRNVTTDQMVSTRERLVWLERNRNVVRPVHHITTEHEEWVLCEGVDE